jgi:Holliday junction resolvase RusA-like endonuclease
MTLEIPLDWQLSKNNRITRTKEGRTIFNKNQSQVDALSTAIFYMSKANACVWEKRKIWIWIVLHKINNRGDCANMVDSISDAIKKAILIDDCFYSFVVDQVVDKKEIIEIRIIQES